MTSRRAFLFGAAAASITLAAPAIVRAESLMKIMVPKRGIILPPEPWIECAGQLLDRKRYADLFAVLGTVYGEGDGKTTFKAPDLTSSIKTTLPTRAAPLDGSITSNRFLVRAAADESGIPVGYVMASLARPEVRNLADIVRQAR